MTTRTTTSHRLLPGLAAAAMLVGALAAGLHHHGSAFANLFGANEDMVSTGHDDAARLVHTDCALCRAVEQKSSVPAPAIWFVPAEIAALAESETSSNIRSASASAAQPRAPPQASTQHIG